MTHSCDISDLLTELPPKPFPLSSPTSLRRQKTWWHRHERQAKRGRNGAENWREIKWIDKDGWKNRKVDRLQLRRDGWGAVWGEEWCYWYAQTGEEGALCFPPQSAIWRHSLQRLQREEGFISFLTNMNNKIRGMRWTGVEEPQKDQGKKNLVQPEVRSSRTHTSICHCD